MKLDVLLTVLILLMTITSCTATYYLINFTTY